MRRCHLLRAPTRDVPRQGAPAWPALADLSQFHCGFAGLRSPLAGSPCGGPSSCRRLIEAFRDRRSSRDRHPGASADRADYLRAPPVGVRGQGRPSPNASPRRLQTGPTISERLPAPFRSRADHLRTPPRGVRSQGRPSSNASPRRLQTGPTIPKRLLAPFRSRADHLRTPPRAISKQGRPSPSASPRRLHAGPTIPVHLPETLQLPGAVRVASPRQ